MPATYRVERGVELEVTTLGDPRFYLREDGVLIAVDRKTRNDSSAIATDIPWAFGLAPALARYKPQDQP